MSIATPPPFSQSPLPGTDGLSEEIQYLLGNPEAFLAYYFPHRLGSGLQPPHLRLIENTLGHYKSLTLFPATFGKCLDPDALVDFHDGSRVPARDVKAGDRLSHGTCVASESNGVRDTVLVTAKTGQSLVCTANHPFLVNGVGWVAAGDLTDRHELVLGSWNDEDHGLPYVQSVERMDRRETWALQVDTGRHVTNGILTHNTTIISELLPIWAICRDKNIRIAVIAKNDDEVESIARSIKSEMIDNDELVRDFGPFYDKDSSWTMSRISVAGRTRRGKSDTLAMFGSGAKTVLGYRTDWTIADDVVTAENSNTPELRAKMSGWFNKSVATGPEDPAKGRLSVVGTKFHPDDLYAELEEKINSRTGETIYATQWEDAIVDEEAKLTLWPERWSWDALMDKRDEVGTLDFNKRYRNIAVDESQLIFREEFIKGGYAPTGEKYPGCIDTTYVAGDFDESWIRTSGIDPASSKNKRSKFTVHITIAMGSCREHETCLWIIDTHRAQLTVPRQVDLIIDQHATYAPMSTVFEANAYQSGLGDLVKEKLDKIGAAYNLEPHYTSDKNKPDPETGVQAMAPWFENGRVHIPWGNPESRRKMGFLVDELIAYPGRYTDSVMAMWFAWRKLQANQMPMASFNRLTGRPAANPLLRRHRSSRLVANPYYALQRHGGEE